MHQEYKEGYFQEHGEKSNYRRLWNYEWWKEENETFKLKEVEAEVIEVFGNGRMSKDDANSEESSALLSAD